MKHGGIHLNRNWRRVRVTLLGVLSILFLLCMTLFLWANAKTLIVAYGNSPREQTKARLMYLIRYEGWDPYSSDMTVEEFYALMELFEEGRLPLDKEADSDSGNTGSGNTGSGNTGKLPGQASGAVQGPSMGGLVQRPGIFNGAITNGTTADPSVSDATTPQDNTPRIPREKFMYSGLSEYKGENGPLEYKNDENYEPYDPATGKRYTIDGEYFVADSKKYVLDDNDGRLYLVEGEEGYEERVTYVQYAHAFYNARREVVLSNDGRNFSNPDGSKYTASEGDVFLSISSETNYEVGADGTLYKRDGDGTITSEAFAEAPREWYVYNGTVYEWKNNALYQGGVSVSGGFMRAVEFYYPQELDNEGYGYMRPRLSEESTYWNGIELNEKNQAVILREEENQGYVGGYANQDLFDEIEGYYVKNVTINGIAAKILGMLLVKDGNTSRYVYYYMSSDDQDTQVSTTMLPDAQKFIVEYVPIEHVITYKVYYIDDETGERKEVTSDTSPYGDGVSWVDAIYDINRPERTTDGRYAFNVAALYGYETAMILEHDVQVVFTKEEKYYDQNGNVITRTNEEGKEVPITQADLMNVWEGYAGALVRANDGKYTFERATAKASKDALLAAYNNFLRGIGVDPIDDGNISGVNTPDAEGKYTLKYIGGGANAPAHQAVLDRISERMNKLLLLNDGYALGTEPSYDGGAADKGNVTPNVEKGPRVYTLNATFYNEFVREDRTVVAVVRKRTYVPIFNTPIIWSGIANVDGRGSSAYTLATQDIINKGCYYELYGEKWYDYEEDYRVGGNPNGGGNLWTSDGWGWNGTGYGYDKLGQPNNSEMVAKGDGTYYWQWTFQTNSNPSYTLDSLAINGTSMRIAFLPKLSNRNGAATSSATTGLNAYKTTTTLADGATVTLEFLMIFNNGNAQRVYRITVDGARADVSVTGMNLMQSTGAKEISTYELVGIYAPNPDGSETSQAEPAIQYWPDADNDWRRSTLANVIVKSDNEGIKYDRAGGEDNYYGANIRFKTIEGYGNPYFLFEAPGVGVINGQASATRAADDSISRRNPIRYFSEIVSYVAGLNDRSIEYVEATAPCICETNSAGEYYASYLKSNCVYKDDLSGDDWYYIRLTTQGDNVFGLVTIVARPAKYVVNYYTYNIWTWEDEQIKVVTKLNEGTQEMEPRLPENNPRFPHYDVNGNLLYSDTYDDNGGFYYDTLSNSNVPLPTNASGILRPVDPLGEYNFTGWVVADYRDPTKTKPQTDRNGNLILRSTRAISITELNEYAVLNRDFSTDDLDVYVITMVATWEKVDNPFYYDVVLNWVDAEGVLHEEEFHEYWNQVLTQSPAEGQDLFVYVNTTASPLQDWIAQYPTYTFWDAVNSANGEDPINESAHTGEEDRINIAYLKSFFAARPDFGDESVKRPTEEDFQIITALNAYLVYDPTNPESKQPEQYEEILEALLSHDLNKDGKDGFRRLGYNHFAVLQNHAKICVWMFEDKGGLVFHKDVKEEPFTPDDEFYYTVKDVTVGTEHVLLNNVYKAYPEAQYYSADRKQKYIIDNEEGDYYYKKDAAGNDILSEPLFADEDGNPVRVRLIKDSDAWRVTFINGTITDIEKNGVHTTYFTLKHDEGIELYVPAGAYTVVEMGSKSGGSYQANIDYVADDGSNKIEESWEFPPPGSNWVRGSLKRPLGENEVIKGVEQVAVQVDFEIGAAHVVKILTFHNETTSISLEKKVDALDEIKNSPPGIPASYNNAVFTITLTVQLYETTEGKENIPLLEEKTGKYYFLGNRYKVRYISVPGTDTVREEITSRESIKVYFEREGEDANKWTTSFQMKAGDRIVLVMEADYKKVNYWVDEDATVLNDYDTATTKAEQGYVYRKTITSSEEGKKPTYEYIFYRTLAAAQNAHREAEFREDTYDDDPTYAIKEYIVPATLKNMDLTPMISPSSGQAKAGQKAVVEVVNWFGELPGFGYLLIVQADGDKNDNFLFLITSARTGAQLVVSVKGSGYVYVYLQCGSYTIRELSDWQWRYENGKVVLNDRTESPEEDGEHAAVEPPDSGINVTITLKHDTRKHAYEATYSNDKNHKGWLGVEKSADATFKPKTEDPDASGD